MTRLVDWLIERPESLSGYFSWLPPLVARIVVGWVFMWSGWAKLNNLLQMIENFTGWGIPYPTIVTPFVSGVEFLGGLLLLLGLFTRIAAPPLVIVMIVAIISAKWDQIDSLGNAAWLRGSCLHGPVRLARGCRSGPHFSRQPVATLVRHGGNTQGNWPSPD